MEEEFHHSGQRGKSQNTRKSREHEDYKSLMAATELPRPQMVKVAAFFFLLVYPICEEKLANLGKGGTGGTVLAAGEPEIF